MKFLDNLFNKKQLSCNEELNILDINDNIFFSLDGYISIYIKVTPIAFEYLSNTEKQRIIQRLISEIAGEKEIIKIIVMSLPISINDMKEFLNSKRIRSKNSFKRNKLLEQIKEIEKISYKGEMIEKQIFIQLFEKLDNDKIENLQKRAKEFILKLQNAGLSSYILDKREILQFFNAFLNMRFKNETFNNIWGEDYE